MNMVCGLSVGDGGWVGFLEEDGKWVTFLQVPHMQLSLEKLLDL